MGCNDVRVAVIVIHSIHTMYILYKIILLHKLLRVVYLIQYVFDFGTEPKV